ncbi:MAG: hypothetical protein HZB66_00185 [Candidatus Aenigmarchaeota archaeon]|nr:hypothetical protein [Candidatus Aenigmarchaeota archaeon]
MRPNGTITDDSSDTVTLSYKWYKNSAEIAGQTQWNLTGSSFNHYDNITCEIMPTDNHNYAGAARNSTTIQIKNSPPVVSIGNTFTDYTTQHAFNVTATATDADGLADITSCKIWRRTGSDAYVSEAGEISSGNCIAKIDTTDSDGSGAFAVNDNISIMVEFFDASDSTNTTASLHAIPNQPPSASNGDVLPSSPNTTQTLTCSYTFSDLEGDADNSTFKWYKDNVVQAGLNSATVSGSYTTEGETWKCEIAPIDQYGGTGSAINSTNETIVNSPPTISIGNTFTDYTTEHAFNVTATASDADGLTDITSCKVWRRTGSDAHVSESGIYISATGNCTAKINTSDSDGGGTFAVYDSVDIKVEFFDEAESVNTSSSSNSIPNRAPETSTPALVPATVYKNTANITCANTTTTDADSDNVTFHYKWFNNSAVITGAITNYLTNDSYAHFNNITCQIMPDDSYINGSARNVSVVITNTPPAVASSEIVPAVAYETTVLNCTNGSVSDIDSDVVTLLYKWYKNSAVISGQTQWNLTGTYFNHFDNVTCQITPYDGYDSGTPVNATAVQILNTVPAISNVAVTPSIAYTNDTLTCSGTFADVDSDTEAGSTFKWYRNGTVIDGQTNRQLNAYVIRKHENVSCEYRPKDGYDFGSAANSTMVTILNAKPIVSSVSILPSPAYENSVLNCTNGTVTDRDNDTITLFYKWYRNGSEIGQVAWNLTGTYFNHFDNVTCQITPYDNDENGTAINSSTLQISNTPPTLDSASIVPATAYETSVLNCTNGSTSDVDADSVTLLYKWYKNSIVISGQTQWNLTGTYFNHFDNVTCQITPYDGYDSGTPVNASAVSILNTPPVIANVAVTPSIAYTNDTLTCDGTFTDVDSDAEAGSMFKWYRNGTVIDGQTNRQLSAYVIRKHENVSCEYRPKDGYDFGSAANSTMVTILNAKPITTLTNITPKIAYETSVLNCTNGTIIDRDNDTITLFYKWYRNGSEIGQVAWNLTGTYFNHFDNITCQIMPYDTEENGTSANDTIEIQNSLPVIYFINVTPSADGWGETFTFITNVSDVDNDSVNISLWLSSNNATWSYDRTTNCTSCLQKTKINITKTDFTCSNIGQNFFRINATDEYGATNISWSANFTLLKSTLNQGNMVITQGDGTRVGTRGTESTHITVSIYDSKRNIFVTSGVRGRIWVMKNSTLWNTGQPCTTTSNGNCTITFDPDCTYQGDAREFRGGIYNDTCYFDVNSTTGHIIIDPGVECMHEITFVLELNISGTEDDVFRTSAGTGDAFFISGETTQYYICVEDAAIEKIPVFGIVFSGDDFSTLNISSRKMQMSQYQAGNMFIMPVTYGGCSAIQRKIDLIKNNRFLTQPYAWFNDNTYPLEISLDYPVNIRGEESLKGSFILTLEKNGSTIDAKVR